MFIFIFLCIISSIIILKFFAILTKGNFTTNVSLEGKTALVTGGNAGMGYEIALFLASRGCRVIIADISNAVDTAENIGKTTGNPHVVYHHVDLSQLTSVRKLAAILLSTEPRLDIMINNAGCAGYTCKTQDDIYKVLQVNYIGHILLVHLLAPLLIKRKGSRIVFVSSLLAFLNTLNVSKTINSGLESQMTIISQLVDYANSKACLIACSDIFAKKLQKYDVKVVSCHPGIVKTKICKTSFSVFQEYGLIEKIAIHFVYFVVALFGKSPKDGAKCALYCALSEEVKSGDFAVDCRRFFKPYNMYNEKQCLNIWDESIQLAKIKHDELLQ